MTQSKRAYFLPAQWECQPILTTDAYYEELKATVSRVVPRYVNGREPVAMSLTVDWTPGLYGGGGAGPRLPAVLHISRASPRLLRRAHRGRGGTGLRSTPPGDTAPVRLLRGLPGAGGEDRVADRWHAGRHRDARTVFQHSCAKDRADSTDGQLRQRGPPGSQHLQTNGFRGGLLRRRSVSCEGGDGPPHGSAEWS